MKIVAVDNFDRGTYDDALACENVIHSSMLKIMYEALNLRFSY